ncbi:MAG: tRNA 2-selenouridine(34) synthase MnmH [Bacteroidetes bacterium]|nr:tRNA 2-selenouridine(34) synthase MnmH [Bacteroidota bacterium]
MPQKRISLEEFLQLRRQGLPVADVRSEKEFADGHIPGAVNMPLLINEHRVIVGTAYKQHGKDAAIRKGWDLAGPRFGQLYRHAAKIAGEGPLLLHCWRGGMRSDLSAWISGYGGLEVFVLEGGYKAYRHHVLHLLNEAPELLHVVGGATGSGKTAYLQMLRDNGEQMIDLEALASHKGSSFGALGMNNQPTQEQFENKLAEALAALNPELPVWVEYESRTIGRIVLPEALFLAMQQAPMLELQLERKERIQRLLREYGHFPLEALELATLRISKRLGGLKTAQALEALRDGNLEEWISHCLYYYDKTYRFGLSNHKGIKEQKPWSWV